MLGLDVKTIIVINALAAFSASIGLFLTSRKLDDGTRHGLIWAYGNVSQMMAYIFLGLRDVIPLVLSTVFGNLFLYLALVLYVLELQIYYNRRFRTILIIIILSMVTLGLALYYFTVIEPDINARVILASFWTGVISMFIFYTIVRNYRRFPSRSSLLTGIGFLL